jgi:hypothetical protein
MAWTDPAYKRARRHRTAIAELAPVAETAGIRGDVRHPRRPWPGWDPDLDTPTTGDTWDDPTRYPWQ